MRRAIAVVTLAAALAACGMVGALVDGIKLAHAVEGDLAQTTGVKPDVGFNWNNGRLVTVTVTYPQLYDREPLPALAEKVRAAIAREFKQTPENIVLAFSLGKGNPPATAQTGAVTPQQFATPDRPPRLWLRRT